MRAAVAEAFRQDADDGVAPAVQRDRPADGSRISTEAPAECRSAHQRDTVVALHLLVRAEHAPELRAHVQHAEEPGRHARDRQPLCAIGTLQRCRRAVERTDALEEARFAKIVQFSDGEPALAGADPREQAVDGDEPGLLAPAERAQQHRVHDAEDGGGRADPQRQREHRRGSEPGRAEQAAERKAEIAKQSVHEVSPFAGQSSPAAPSVERSSCQPLPESAPAHV